MKGLFVTGTDTEIGKTLVTAALTLALQRAGARVAPIKAVAAGQAPDAASGRWVNDDVAQLHAVQSLGMDLDQVGPLQLREACAPHIAARQEGRTIANKPLLDAIARSAALGDWALVEGVGGFRVPLGEGWDTADLAKSLGLPVLLVVGLRLGCLNHALLTAEAIRARGLHLAGWVANTVDPAMPHAADNLCALQAGLRAPCWGHLPRLPDASAAQAARHFSLSPADLLRALRDAQPSAQAGDTADLFIAP